MVILLKVQTLMCLTIYFISFDMTSANNQTNRCEDWKTISFSTENVKEVNNETIIVNNIQYPKNITYTVGNKTKVCICLMKSCLKKCCPVGQSLNSSGYCVKNQSQFTIDSINYYNLQGKTITEFIPDTDHFEIVYDPNRSEKCESYALVETNDTYYVLNNGNLYYNLKPNDLYWTETVDTYCLEYLKIVNKIAPVLCADPETPSSAASSLSQPIISSTYLKKIQLVLYPIFIFTSMPFLLLTFITYCILSEYRNMTGKSLLSQVANIFIAFMILGILMVHGSKVPTSPCIIMGKKF